MIGKLKGIIDSYGEDFVILDVNGVGYVVQCSSRTLQNLPRPGEAASLAILGTFSAGELSTAIGTQDKAMIARAPGVGPKLAQRLVLELKDKAPVFGHVDPAVMRLAGEDEAKSAPKPVQDAISALVNLGYGRPQAAAAIAASARALGDSAQTGALIRQGLKELAG